MRTRLEQLGRVTPPSRQRVRVAAVELDPLAEHEVVAWVFAELRHGRGGHVLTPNVDICRLAARDPELRALVGRADLAVADGMPLVWASRLLGTPLPERVTGADLIWALSEAAARHGVPVYLLGGPPGAAEGAAVALRARCPRLVVAGTQAPPYGFESAPGGVAAIRDALRAAAPGLVFVGLGFPKQDRLIEVLRADLPGAWFVGCGSAVAFAAGAVRRAPEWMRGAGLEWLFRLLSEPGRLARRYLVHDVPFALRLLAGCALRRAVRRAPTSAPGSGTPRRG
ncbi:WecB/TagA/CpsF family glycosyltransferase [Microtetraspora malaysiensis]|uniref:WecB/TagA/CpsF family glycosyltransferase n=1 Tax=Microtetraspora malaysiensis TaxID=161358 RepID=A0ABW6SJN4_9ACTN